MRKLPKILSFSFVFLLMLSMLILSGCHGKKDSVAFETPESFDLNEKYEITFWAKNDTNKTQTDIYEKAIKDFEEIYPNIHVNLRLYTDYGKIYNDVITNIATDTTPNVCITYPDHIATYLTGENVVVPLDGLISDKNFGLGGKEVKFDAPKKNEMVDKYLEECRILGTTYALPYMRSSEALYINKDFVEKLGYEIPDVVTWDFIFEVSEKAVEKDSEGNYKINNQKTMIPFIYKSTDNMMIQMVEQKKSGYSNDGGEIFLFNDETKDMLFEISKHAKTGAFSTFKISSYPANFLNAGQCIFAIDSTAGATWMGPKAPLSDIAADKIVDFEVVVKEIPQYDPSDIKMISQGPSLCVFNKENPKEVLASWLFTQYLLTNDVQIAYAETEGYVPVTKKAQEDPVYLDYLSHKGENDKLYYDVKIDATELVMRNVENTFTTPVFNGSASLREASGQLIESVTKSTRRKETVDDKYVENLYKDVNSLYRLDQISAGSGRRDLGPLPDTAVKLIVIVSALWVGIIAVNVLLFFKNRKKK